MRSERIRIESIRPLEEGIVELILPAPAPTAPGQFYMLRAEHSAHLLPRPISVCDWGGGKLRLVVAVVGRGTGEIARLRPGDLLRVTGPLGNGFAPDALNLTGPVALVGGGVGVAPMLYTAGCLRERGVAADAFLGFRDRPFLQDELAARVRKMEFSTETGAAGHKGLVTDLFDPADYVAVLCCGPAPMMRAVTERCVQAGTPVWVSLEQRMACGLGACLVCTCADRRGEHRRTCVDGPVFRGEEIDFDA